MKSSGRGQRKPSGERVPWESDAKELLLPQASSSAGSKSKNKGKSHGQTRQAGQASGVPLNGDVSQDEESEDLPSSWNLSRARAAAAASSSSGTFYGGDDDGSASSDEEVQAPSSRLKNLHLLGAFNLANNGNRCVRADPPFVICCCCRAVLVAVSAGCGAGCPGLECMTNSVLCLTETTVRQPLHGCWVHGVVTSNAPATGTLTFDPSLTTRQVGLAIRP
jgi:hypothetical protein